MGDVPFTRPFCQKSGKRDFSDFLSKAPFTRNPFYQRNDKLKAFFLHKYVFCVEGSSFLPNLIYLSSFKFVLFIAQSKTFVCHLKKTPQNEIYRCKYSTPKVIGSFFSPILSSRKLLFFSFTAEGLIKLHTLFSFF